MSRKKALITGGAGGFGQAISKELIEDGFEIFLTDIDEKALTKITLPHTHVLLLDITDAKSIRKAFEVISGLTDGLDALINNAGHFDRFPLTEVDPERIEKLIKINVLGHQFVTQQFFPLLHKRKGRIINISSESALVGLPLLAYGMSKSMFDLWTDQLRLELTLQDMHVSTIRPGGHKTGFLDKTIDVINEVEENSKYALLMNEMKDQTDRILSNIQSHPKDVAVTVRKALSSKHPKKEYWVNVSRLYRVLSLIPESLREKIIIAKMKKKIQKELKHR